MVRERRRADTGVAAPTGRPRGVLLADTAEYRLLFEQSPAPMYVFDQESLRILAVNRAMVRHYGWSRAELLRMTARDIRPPEAVRAFLGTLRKHRDTPTRTLSPVRHWRKDGTPLEVRATGHRVQFEGRVARLVVVHDLSALRRAEEQIRRSEERLRSILANSIDVLYRRDLQADRYDCVSPSVKILTGFTPAEFMRGGLKSTVDRVHPEDLERSQRAIAEVMSSASGRGGAEYRYRRKDGHYRWFSDHYTITRDTNGQPRFWVGTVRDVTDLKRAEAALRRSHATLETKVRKRTAQLQAMTAKMIGAEEEERERIGHMLQEDVLQSLAGLRYEIEALRRSSPHPRRTVAILRAVDRTLEAARSLSADLRPPMLPAEKLSVALTWLAGDLMRRFGLAVRLRVDPAAEPESAPRRIFVFRAARELLRNVLQHARTRTARLILAPASGHRLRLEVSDLGAGFRPGRPPTAGVGLFRIRERASQLGGDLRVASSPGRGTRVTLVLPQT